jgi:hypothetical protein
MYAEFDSNNENLIHIINESVNAVNNASNNDASDPRAAVAAKGGRATSTGNWTPNEGLNIFKEARDLNFPLDIAADSPLLTQLQTNISSTRKVNALRDHYKEMITQVRSLSMAYSKDTANQDNHIKCPVVPYIDDLGNSKTLDELLETDDFQDHVFKNYAMKVYEHALNNNLCKNKGWWNTETFIFARFFVWRLDALASAPVQKAEATKNKFEAERKALADEAQRRKRAVEDEQRHERDMKQRLVDSCTESNNIMNTMAEAIGKVVTALTPSPPGNFQMYGHPLENGNEERLSNVENRLKGMETSINDIKDLLVMSLGNRGGGGGDKENSI